MAEAPKTSFIPKQTTGRVAGSAPRHKRNLNIFNVIAAIVFIGGLVVSAGVYVYKGYTEKSLGDAKSELTTVKNSFSQGDIESIRELDRRIRAAEALLDQHLSPSLIFSMLEARTQQDIQFDGFLYVRNPSGSVDVELDGQAARFNTVALQADQFDDSSVLATAIFSNIDVAEGQEGKPNSVTFKVIATADGDVIAYQAEPSNVDAGSDNINTIEALNTDTELDELLSGVDEELETIDDALNGGSGNQ